MARPKSTKRERIDAAHLRAGYVALIDDLQNTLKRWKPEQIEKSKTLIKRRNRLSFYQTALKQLDAAIQMPFSSAAGTGRPSKETKMTRRTNLIPYGCIHCGYLIRLTAKWIDCGVPACPNRHCANRGTAMEEMTVRRYEFAHGEVSRAMEERLIEAERQEKELREQEDRDAQAEFDAMANDSLGDFLRGE